MQDGDESKPQIGNEPNEARDSEQNSSEQDSGHPEKVYDFVHQHFGVALKSGGPESRAAEASGRNAVADKPQGARSDSWHALKNLIRYQNSTTSTNERKDFADDGSFGAQWNLSSSVLDDMDDLLAPHPDDEVEPHADQSVEVLDSSIELEATQHADVEAVQQEALHENHVEPSLDVEVDGNETQTKDLGEDTLKLSADAIESVRKKSAHPGEDTWHLTVEPADEDENSAVDAAEARSKFGSMNAFQKMKSRTQPQSETREKQAITGDMPQPVEASEKHEDAQGNETTEDNENWETLEPPGTEGATIMNQWCSTSTGDSIPSLAELDSIPTPSVLQKPPTDKKSFSIKTPGVHQEQEIEPPPPDAVHSTARASWLQAASEYSASVIKAVTHQMMGLNTKPKKVTPESPEFQSSEPPEQSDDISSM